MLTAPKPAGLSGLWAAIAPYLSVSAIVGAVGAVGIFIAGSETPRDSAGDGDAASPAEILKDAKPEGMSKPGMGADKYSKPGGLGKANQDFEKLAQGHPTKDQGSGTRSVTFEVDPEIRTRA